jgi:subtilisin family serine protease
VDFATGSADSGDGCLALVQLGRLMQLTGGVAECVIGLVDGPVAIDHPGLAGARVRDISGGTPAACRRAASVACEHGTFVAGILCARRGTGAPAICPDTTLVVRPIFQEATGTEPVPTASPGELAAAVVDCVDAGARLVNVSAALSRLPSADDQRRLQHALDYAAHRGAIVVVAAGNYGEVGTTAITRHPWVLAVTACDRRGRLLGGSNVSASIGRRGLSAPGEGVSSLSAGGGLVVSSGTSVAAPFVTGALALAWSLAPRATAGQLREAVSAAHRVARPALVPPLLDAWAVYTRLAARAPRGEA